MFDHSSITHLVNRIGGEGFSEVFDGLDEELLRMRLLSSEMNVDSSMVEANFNNLGPSRGDLSVEEFREQAVEENGLVVLPSSTVDIVGLSHRTAVTSSGSSVPASLRSWDISHRCKKGSLSRRWPSYWIRSTPEAAGEGASAVAVLLLER